MLRNQSVNEVEVDDFSGEDPETFIQGHQASYEADNNLGLLSSAAALATQEQIQTGHGYTFAGESDMFMSPVGNMAGFISDNFETELYDFLQEHVHLGMMEAI